MYKVKNESNETFYLGGNIGKNCTSMYKINVPLCYLSIVCIFEILTMDGQIIVILFHLKHLDDLL